MAPSAASTKLKEEPVIEAKDEEYRLQRMQTKQKDGTPTVISTITITPSSLFFYF